MAGRKYAVELHKDGITVVTVSPGWVKTNLSGTDIATLEALLRWRNSSNRLMQ
ncbi:hypothetical protein BT69DRAFT_1276205 [Atractiella rhizophila]|nr:hypothetical protein BT69DRAFT_1276205 [Atractiella rhizophila]